MADTEQARILTRFFKTAPGQYGEGDRFLGIRVPATRAIVREFAKRADTADATALIASQWHEIRLAGFLLLIEIYKRKKRLADKSEARHIVDVYLGLIDRGNNWDLVDLVAPKILGDRLLTHPDERVILHQLAAMDGRLWHQRVAIVACWTLIKYGFFDDALSIAERFLSHPHDLIHKASGWMLREVGKRGGMDRLTEFLDRHARLMPRTMLRYSIEKFPDDLRRRYMTL